MSNRKYLTAESQYRPSLGQPYKRVLLAIAEKLNETSMRTFDDLDTNRLAVFELWKRVFPGEPFPKDADVLRKRYDMDPESKLYNQHKP